MLDDTVKGVENLALYRKRMEILEEEVTVYPVSCEVLANGRSDRQWLENVLEGGARIVQLRDKQSPDHVLLEKAKYFREKTRKTGALFIINDRVDLALASEADGVHVGQNDQAVQEVRKQAPDMIIGLSCNTLSQAAELGRAVAENRNVVSYYNIGPLFATTTKQGLKTFLGSKAIAQFPRVCPLPFTTMGGIKYEHIAELCLLGARRLAVVTALTKAADIASETRRWVNEINRNSR